MLQIIEFLREYITSNEKKISSDEYITKLFGKYTTKISSLSQKTHEWAEAQESILQLKKLGEQNDNKSKDQLVLEGELELINLSKDFLETTIELYLELNLYDTPKTPKDDILTFYKKLQEDKKISDGENKISDGENKISDGEEEIRAKLTEWFNLMEIADTLFKGQEETIESTGAQAKPEAAKPEAAKPEAAEQKSAEQEAAEQEAAKQEATEQKAAKQEAAEQKAAEQAAEAKQAEEQKATEQKAAKRKTSMDLKGYRSSNALELAKRQQLLAKENTNRVAALKKTAEKTADFNTSLQELLNDQEVRRKQARDSMERRLNKRRTRSAKESTEEESTEELAKEDSTRTKPARVKLTGELAKKTLAKLNSKVQNTLTSQEESDLQSPVQGVTDNTVERPSTAPAKMNRG